MAYTDDWENLMNGVFGPGGKLRFDTQKTPPEKPGLPDMNAALLEQQKKLDEMLKKQNAELRRDTTQEALAQSRKMLEDMEADGLLAKGTTEVKQENQGSFEGLAAEVKKTVLGQDAFVDDVVRAMRRPFVLGTEAPTARNVILLCGAPGTGRHFTLTETARCMAVRGLLQSDKLAVMDLALYPNPGAEKLFLQDLYAALHAPGEILQGGLLFLRVFHDGQKLGQNQLLPALLHGKKGGVRRIQRLLLLCQALFRGAAAPVVLC